MLIVLPPAISAPLTCSLSSQASNRCLSWGQRCLWAAKQTGFCLKTPGASLDQAKGKSCGPAFLLCSPVQAVRCHTQPRSSEGRRRGCVHTGYSETRGVLKSDMLQHRGACSAGRAWWLRLAVGLIVTCELNQHGCGCTELPDYQRTGRLMSMRSIVVPVTVQMTSGSSSLSSDLEAGP